MGSHNSEVGRWHGNIKFVNNTAYSCTDTAIRAYQFVDCVIANNVVVNPGNIGIQARTGDPNSSNTDRVSITGNVVRGSVADGIQLTGLAAAGTHAREAVVANNTVIVPGGNGIGVNYAYGAVITGNQIMGPGSTAISVQNSDYTVVSGNRVRGGASHGIGVSDSTGGNITGNLLRTLGGYGVILSPNAGHVSVRDNFVAGSTQGAYRASVGSNYNTFTSNTARLDGVTNFAGSALAITSACTGVQHWGNDFQGMGAGSISDAGVSSVTSTANRT
jgi:hypothetical protein